MYELLIYSHTDPTAPLRHCRILPTVVDGDIVLCILLHGGHKGTVPGRQGSEEAELAIPHQVHDVVPEARGAQSYQRRIRAGKILAYYSCVSELQLTCS